MKQYLIPSLLIAVISLFLLSSCSASGNNAGFNIKSSSVSLDDTMQEEIGNVIDDYLKALTTHDHIAMIQCTDDSFIWNYNETEFQNSCRNIVSYSDVIVDYSDVSEINGELQVKVSYTLTLSDDPDDTENACTNVCKEELFYFVLSGNTYAISSVSGIILG